MVMLAFMILVLPMQWILAAFIAAVFHELCHYWAVRLCGGSVVQLRIGAIGSQMEVWGLSTAQEMVCALAGPLGSLMLLFASGWMPRTAICAGFQGLYNMLPVYPFDGGRALRCGTALVFPEKIAVKVCALLEKLCLIAVVFLGVYGSFVKWLGLFPVFLATSIVLRSKMPLKTGKLFGTIE